MDPNEQGLLVTPAQETSIQHTSEAPLMQTEQTGQLQTAVPEQLREAEASMQEDTTHREETASEIDGLMTQEEENRKRFGEYAGVAARLHYTPKWELKRQIAESKKLDDKLSDMHDYLYLTYTLMDEEDRKKCQDLIQCGINIAEEEHRLKNYLLSLEKLPRPRETDPKAPAVRKQEIEIVHVFSLVNHIKSQYALSLRMMGRFMRKCPKLEDKDRECLEKHVLSAVNSIFTSFGGSDQKINYGSGYVEAARMRSEALRGLLCTHSAKYESKKGLTAGERVEKFVQDTLAREMPNQPSAAERAGVTLRVNGLVDKIFRHDEDNEYSMFWIPNAMLPKEGEEADADDPASFQKEEVDQLNEAVLNLFRLSSRYAALKKENEGSAACALAGCFMDTLNGLRDVMNRYSVDADEETKAILSNESLSAEEKQSKLQEVKSRMTGFASRYADITWQMYYTVLYYDDKAKKATLSPKEEARLRNVFAAKEKCLSISPGQEALLSMKINLSGSEERVENALAAMEDMSRIAQFQIKEEVPEESSFGVIRGAVRYEDYAEQDKIFSKELDIIQIRDEKLRAHAKEAEAEEPETTQTETAQAETVQTETARTETAQTETARTETAQTETARTETAQTETAQTETAQTEVTAEGETVSEETISEETHTSRMSQLKGTLEVHIPEKEMQSLSEYTVGKETREGVGKCRAWWIRRGHVSGGQLKKAVNTHVDRMLESRELTDRDLSEAAGNIGQSTGLFSKEFTELFDKPGRKNSVAFLRISKCRELSGAANDEEVLGLLESTLEMLGVQDEETEVSLESDYFRKYPQALKVVLMYKLLNDLALPKTDEFEAATERLNAAKSGVERLYKTLCGSSDYREALEDQNKQREERTRRKSWLGREKDEDGLAVLKEDSFDAFNSLVEAELKKNREGAAIRRKQAENIKEIVGERRKEEEEHKEHKNSKMERYETNLTRLLADAEMLGEGNRYEEIVRQPIRVEVSKRVGPAYRTLLLDRVKRRLRSHFNEAGMGDLPDKDSGMDEIFPELVAQTIKIGYGGIKSEEELENLTFPQINDLSILFEERLKDYPQKLKELKEALEKEEISGNLTFEEKRIILIPMLAGKPMELENAVKSVKKQRVRVEEMKEYRLAVLYGGDEVVKPGIYHDLKKLKANTNRGEFQLRATNRFSRMDDVDNEVADACQRLGLEKPKSFYEFAAEIRSDGETNGDISEKQLKELEKNYKNYVKETWPEVAEFFWPAKYLYYGLKRYGGVLNDVIGQYTDKKNITRDLLNDSDKTTFEKKLPGNLITNLVDKEAFCRRLCREKKIEFTDDLRDRLSLLYSKEEWKTEVGEVLSCLKESRDNVLKREKYAELLETKDRRVKELKSKGLGLLLPVLLEDQKFTEHLVFDKEEEYRAFSNRYFPRIGEVAEELEKHIYIDQYLLDKRSEIMHYVFSDSQSKSVKDSLELEKYDRELEKHALDKDGKITLGDKIRELLYTGTGEEKKEEGIRQEEGNFFVCVLLYDGFDAAFDKKKLNSYRKRAEENKASLEQAMKDVFEIRISGGESYTEERRLFLEKTIRQAERENIFRMSREDYNGTLTARVDGYLEGFRRTQQEFSETQAERDSAFENLRSLIEEKEKGRSAFERFHNLNGRMELQMINAYEMEREEKGERFAGLVDREYDQKLESLPEELKARVKRFLTKDRDQLPKNGALNSFHQEVMNRIAYDIWKSPADKIKEFLNSELVVFHNVRMFYEITSNFLGTFNTTKDFGEERKKNLIGGLMNYYGTLILDPYYKVTADIITEHLEKLFNDEKTGTLAIDLMENDAGGFYAVGSDAYNAGENPLIRMDRREFEKTLKDSSEMKEAFSEYTGLDTETKILAAHLLVRDADLNQPANYLVRVFTQETVARQNRSEMILSYVKGEELAEPDYLLALKALKDGEKLSAPRLKAAVHLAVEARTMRDTDGLAVDRKTYEKITKKREEERKAEASMEEIRIAAEEALPVWDAAAKDFSAPSELTNSEKLWSLYTMLRPFKESLLAHKKNYDGILKQLEKKAKAEEEASWLEYSRNKIRERFAKAKQDHKKILEFTERFLKLEGYAENLFGREEIRRKLSETKDKTERARLIRRELETRQQMAKTEAHFLNEFGLQPVYDTRILDQDHYNVASFTDRECERELKKDPEYQRDAFLSWMDEHGALIDGTKAKTSYKRFDKDEEIFPENVVEAVRKVDRYVARYGNDVSQGKSKTAFGAEILGRPMRQRLFVYFMVENNRVERASGIDAAMAVNDYVPDLDKIKDALEERWYMVHEHSISSVRDTDFVRRHESVRDALSGFGSVNTATLESAIRVLDDENLHVSGQLDEYTELFKNDFEDIMAHQSGKDEQVKEFCRLMAERKYEISLLIKNTKELRRRMEISEDPFALVNISQKKAETNAQLFEVKQAMDRVVSKTKELARFKGLIAGNAFLREKLGGSFGNGVWEEESGEEKIASYVESISSVTGILSSCFDNKLFATLDGLTAMEKLMTHCFTMDFDWAEMNRDTKLATVQDLLSSAGEAAGPVLSMIKALSRSTSEAFGTATDVVGGVVDLATGTIGAYRAEENQSRVDSGMKEVTKRAGKEIRAAEKKGDKKKLAELRKTYRTSYRVYNIQHDRNQAEMTDGVLTATGGAVAIGAVFATGGVAAVIAAIGGVLKAIQLFRSFFSEGGRKEDAIDSFFEMDSLLKEFKKRKKAMGYENMDDGDAKQMLRKMMLRKFHYSTEEDLFTELTVKYSKALYNRIFFRDDGTPILGTDEEEIREREPIAALFAPLEFAWPLSSDLPPCPSVNEMAKNLRGK